jgi:hypothetical protein
MRVRGRGSWVVAVVVAATLAFAFVACNDDGKAEPTATPATEIPVGGSPTADATALQPGGAPEVSVDNVILACREQDAGQLRQFVTDDVNAEVSDADIAAMFGEGTDVRAVSTSTQTQTVNGVGEATAQVRLEVTHDGETETVDREWHLEREGDGVWRFTELPECF